MTEEIQQLEKLLSNTPPGTNRYSDCIACLAAWYGVRSHRTDDISDLEESIKYRRLQLEAVHPNYWDIPLTSLQYLLFRTFEITKKISYLEESITAGYDILKLKRTLHNRFDVVLLLVGSFLAHERFLPWRLRREDLQEIIRLILTVLDSQYARNRTDTNLHVRGCSLRELFVTPPHRLPTRPQCLRCKILVLRSDGIVTAHPSRRIGCRLE